MIVKPRITSDSLLNLLLAGGLIYVLAQPGGFIRMRLDAWREGARLATVAEENWGALAGTSSRTGAESVAPFIIEFGDYECPYCRQVHPHLDSLVRADPRISVGFRHFPLNEVHPMAEGAARAAICAEAQGVFPAMHAVLMETTDWQETGAWGEAAAHAGVRDLESFSECLTSAFVVQRFLHDRELGERLGVLGTPTFFYRYGGHVGYLSEDELKGLIDDSR